MKNRSLIILVLLCFSALYGSAQTYEETKGWITAKIIKGALTAEENDGTVSTDGYYIIITTKESRSMAKGWPYGTEEGDCISTIKIPFSKIIRMDAHVFDGKYHGGVFTLYTYETDISVSYGSNCSVDNFTTSSVGFAVDYNFEEDFMNRLVRAFNKLISYNKENLPRETF